VCATDSAQDADAPRRGFGLAWGGADRPRGFPPPGSVPRSLAVPVAAGPGRVT